MLGRRHVRDVSELSGRRKSGIGELIGGGLSRGPNYQRRRSVLMAASIEARSAIPAGSRAISDVRFLLRSTGFAPTPATRNPRGRVVNDPLSPDEPAAPSRPAARSADDTRK